MQWNEFIFSNKTSYRVARHLVFWGVYCFYFWMQSFAPRKLDEFFIGDTYYFAFLNLCCFGPVFIFAVYFFIYYLLPQTLQKKRYGLFVFYFLMVYLLGTLINYFTAGIFLNSVNYSIPIEPDFQRRIEFGSYNTRWGMIIATVALGIKLSKDWYLQQKENLGILTQKTRTEMRLQKARIHPELLFRSLDTIHSNIRSGSVHSNSMILNLSDLLSYSLYESEMEFVPLEKELIELQHLVCLEQLNKESLVNIQMQTEGEISNKLIAPMVLIKLLEECITLLHQTGASYLLNLHVMVAKNALYLNLSFRDLDEKSYSIIKWPLLFDKANNRLSEDYPATDYQIELAEGQKERAIKLNIKLASDLKDSNTV